MLKFVRVFAGSDPNFEQQLDAVKNIFKKAFPFNTYYADNLERYARGEFPPKSEVVILAAMKGNRLLGFSASFLFADLKVAYLDYIASDPSRSARGIGGALYEMTRDEQRKRGARRMFFGSLPDEPGPMIRDDLLAENRRRQAFYERFGARPIIGTGYERTDIPSNRGDATTMLYDPMGNETPLSRRAFRAVVARILLAKSGLEANEPLVTGLLKTIVDDPVRVRPPRYPAAPPRKRPALRSPFHVVVTASEAPTIEHSPFKGYWERPARVAAVRRALEGLPFTEHRATTWGLEHIMAVHDRKMVEFLQETAVRIPEKRIVYPEVFPLRFPERLPRNFEMKAGYFCNDTTTPLTSEVYAAARRAVDAALTGASLISTHAAPWCYAVVRPPGHHAERRVFGGFCYFNNAAIAANYLSYQGRVPILDVDYHHGNGTQDIFYERGDVLTVSLHGHPEESYPFFAGFEDERGRGPGEGFNRNYPIWPGVDDAGYMSVLGRAIRRIRAFKPRHLVVSLGIDIMRGDPLGTFFITGDGMHRIGEAIGREGYPSLIIQEGGYNLANVRRGVREFLTGFASGYDNKEGPPR